MMVGWHHQLNGHELGQTLGDGEGSLACCSPQGRRESDMTWQLKNNKKSALNTRITETSFTLFYFSFFCTAIVIPYYTIIYLCLSLLFIVCFILPEIQGKDLCSIRTQKRNWTQSSQLISFNSVQSLSHVRFFVTPRTAACQASLFITNSQSLLKLMFVKSVMPSNHLILCYPLLLLPSIFPHIRVFSNESLLPIRWPKYWSFSFNINMLDTYLLKDEQMNK